MTDCAYLVKYSKAHKAPANLFFSVSAALSATMPRLARIDDPQTSRAIVARDTNGLDVGTK
jgi:hypothetical protein